ncbi:pullulanase-type alpha-1,6-glucosidase [Agreia sp.]|uniref:pullulanase-type alpha-1,6-glucosidase n=1 Tax=Agreia sp. TaxID=1872416 RepID=UPI0035BC4207
MQRHRIAAVLATVGLLAGTLIVGSTSPAAADEYSQVVIAGNHQSELGCAGDWTSDCTQSQLTLRADGVYAGTFDLPAGEYEYKITTNGSWDVNFGADGAPGGANVLYAHPGGPITFYFDPVTHRFQNTSEGPIVTLAGSFQSEIGCPGDWNTDCLGTWLQDGDKNGIYEWSTSALPAGNYETKVAHNLTWDESYGVGGDTGGGNYGFATGGQKQVQFRYDITTHLLDIIVTDPPVAGTGEERAHWISADTLAWPAALLGDGDPTELTWSLHHSAEATLALTDGDVQGGDSIALRYDPAGLTTAQQEKFPALRGYLALHPVDLSTASVKDVLTHELAVLQERDGTPTAFTGVQLPGVLDDLYADDLHNTDLGITWSGGTPTFTLWAPTAQNASLTVWNAQGDPQQIPATFDDSTGVWTVEGRSGWKNSQYEWEVVVYAPSTDRIERNAVTDPYSVALTTDSSRSVAVDLADPAYRPAQWAETPAPQIAQPEDRVIYELHVRDFSITDDTVPEELRGTYKAFTADSDGTRQLRELAEAGMNTVHLLPTFDIASIRERRADQATPNCDLASYGPASTGQQACVAQTAAADGYNWGYDPYHYNVPEGSYATNPEDGARVDEFRQMVGGLHDDGLQVVLDVVYNHTAASGQNDKSVLDKVVPGYYQRLDAAGNVQTSTCCQNVATEHAAAEKLMVDSLVTWARDYKVDGFRFDLMGHHSRDNLLAARAALDELTIETDGVDGSKIYLYGEGWNFGEVADNALFEQAAQGQLGGTGIGTFNDRLRDAVHGGNPTRPESTFEQGYGTGLGTDPNGHGSNGSAEEALAELAAQSDLVRLGLAGNLAAFSFVTSDGQTSRGDQLVYSGQPAGYATEPDEIVNYVDAHDDLTLFDVLATKLPQATPMADRVRMNTLSLATVTLSQSPSLWHAGTDLLRSKSLDANSYDSGDWFNRIDWSGQESTFGSGLPPAADAQANWDAFTPLLTDPALKPTPADIATAHQQALTLLELKQSNPLLRLGSTDRILEKVSFPGSGPDQAPGVITMSIDDSVGEDVDPDRDGILVVFNASPQSVTETVPGFAGREFTLSPIQASSGDAIVRQTGWDATTGAVTIPARTVAVLEDATGDTPPEHATIELEDDTLSPGQTVTVHGDGFQANETVSVALTGPATAQNAPAAQAAHTLATVTVATDGSFSIDVTIPTDAASGAAQIQATGGQSARIAVASVTIVTEQGSPNPTPGGSDGAPENPRGGALAATGGTDSGGLLIAACMLLTAGVGLAIRRRVVPRR